MCFLERSASTTASSASGAVRKQAEEVGSPWPSGTTGRVPDASTEALRRLSTERMLMLPAAASGVPADGRKKRHRDGVTPTPSSPRRLLPLFAILCVAVRVLGCLPVYSVQGVPISSLGYCFFFFLFLEMLGYCFLVLSAAASVCLRASSTLLFQGNQLRNGQSIGHRVIQPTCHFILGFILDGQWVQVFTSHPVGVDRPSCMG